MHLITLGDQEEASQLGGRLTGRYPEAIVQGTSLSHPRLVELPAYRRVAVFARICGKRTDVSPLCESDSGKAQRDSPWRDTRTTPAARSPSIPHTTRPPSVSGLPLAARGRLVARVGLTARARLAARSVGGRAPAAGQATRPPPALEASPAIRASWSILSLIGPRLHPSNTLGVSDMQICYSPTTR